MITCIKSGCNVYLEEYGAWVHGDAYADEGRGRDVLVIRVSQVKHSMVPFEGERRQHFRVSRIDQWYDRHKHEQSGGWHVSTLISSGSGWKKLGDYDGEPIE